MPGTGARSRRIGLLLEAASRGPGLDQRAVHREMFLAQQVVLARLNQHRLQQPLAHRAFNQPLPVLGKYRYIPHRVVHLQTNKPAE